MKTRVVSHVVSFLEALASERGASSMEAGRVVPFVKLTAQRFEREQVAKNVLAELGYYRVFDAGRL